MNQTQLPISEEQSGHRKWYIKMRAICSMRENYGFVKEHTFRMARDV